MVVVGLPVSFDNLVGPHRFSLVSFVSPVRMGVRVRVGLNLSGELGLGLSEECLHRTVSFCVVSDREVFQVRQPAVNQRHHVVGVRHRERLLSVDLDVDG